MKCVIKFDNEFRDFYFNIPNDETYYWVSDIMKDDKGHMFIFVDDGLIEILEITNDYVILK